MFAGSGELRCYAADEDDDILIGRCMAVRLGSFSAIIAYFDAAEFVVPPLRIAA